MEDEDQFSSSEEVDEDLEVALYSQIHFDPVIESFAQTTNDFLSNVVQPSFQVGVKSYLSKKRKKNTEKRKETKISPDVFNQNFLSFCGDASGSNVKNVVDNEQSKECSPDTGQATLKNVDRLSEDRQQDIILLSESSDMKQQNNKEKRKEGDDNVWSKFNDDDDDVLLTAITTVDKQTKDSTPEKESLVGEAASLNEESGNNSIIIISPDSSPSKIQDSPDDEPMPKGFLRFSITRAPRNVVKSSSPVPEKKSETNQKEKDVRKRAQKPSKTASKKPKVSKLEEFLKISSEKKIGDSGEKVGKKKVSKQEAAVRPRKPPVVIRHAPAVVVKYHQHSDTNTDYSDSEDSNTPVKLKKVSQVSGVSKPRKRNLQPDPANSSDTTSDEEGEIVAGSSVGENDEGKEEDSSEDESGEEERTKVDAEETQDLTEETPGSNSKKSEEDSSSGSGSSSDEEGLDINAELITQSGLDFNVEGGMKALLKAPVKNSSNEKWNIDNQDRTSSNTKLVLNRYFNPRVVKCRNCDQEGHLAFACPHEKKIMCIFCGNQGHHYTKCPASICYNCNGPGHKSMDCPEPRKSRFWECERCWMKGHSKDACPDLWRQYHETIGLDSETIVKSKDKNNPKVYCFNCGQKGHLGYECYAERMDRFVQFLYPFIAQYDKIKPKGDKRDAEKRSRRKESEEDYNGRKKRKEEKSDAWNRKVNKHGSSDTNRIDDLNIQIDRHQSSSDKDLKRKTSTTSKSRDKKDSRKNRDSEKTFQSGNTVFRFQEPSNPKFSSGKNPQSFAREDTSNQFQQQSSNVDYNIDNEFEGQVEVNFVQDSERRDHKSKSRKTKQKKNKKQWEDSELLEDLSRHQVSNNEWWKEEGECDDDFEDDVAETETSTRKSRREKKNLKRKEHHHASPPSTSNAEFPHSKKFKGHSSREQHHHSYTSYSHEQHHYHHHHHHLHYQQNHPEGEYYEEDFISLNSRPAASNPNSSYQGNRKKRKEKSYHNRNIGNNGFRARGWVRNMY